MSTLVKHLKTAGALSVLFMALSTSSWAFSTGFNVNILGGPGFYFSGTTSTQFQYGLGISYALPMNIEVGAEVNTGGGITQLAGEINYFFTDALFLGVQAGPLFGNVTGFGFGPQGGYDFPITADLTLGPEIEYQYNAISSGNTGSLDLLASLKYHF